MFELEEVFKKSDKEVSKNIIKKDYVLSKIKDVLTVIVCEKTLSQKGNTDSYDLYIRRDGCYVEFKDKQTLETFIYSIKSNGNYIEYNPNEMLLGL